MKIALFYLYVLIVSHSAVRAEVQEPPSNMIDHAEWARDTNDLNLRIKRLEGFLKHFIPLEEGTEITTEYEDGASILAVTGSAWALARSYVEAGKRDEALKMIDWLQEHDSKSDLYSKKNKANKAEMATPRKPFD